MRIPNTRPSAWALAGLVLVTGLAACGKANTPEAPKTDAARQFAQCMRANGVPDFPDPDADGQFRGQTHEQQNDPKFAAANEKCASLAPGGDHERTSPALVEEMRKYSQCMRDNGVTDFPDPDAEGRLRGAGHEQQDDPTFKAASAQCRSKLPGGGSH
jgi:hypothetical protein